MLQKKTLADYGITEFQLRQAYEEYKKGVSKCALEKKYLKTTAPHGKRITKLFRNFLNQETECVSVVVLENIRLKNRVQQLEDQNRKLKIRLKQRNSA